MRRCTLAEADATWSAVDHQLRRSAGLHEQVSAEQWPSLCPGWTVRHISAPLTLQQQRVRDAVTVVTPLETLSDVLVHSQVIAVPLGRELASTTLPRRGRDLLVAHARHLAHHGVPALPLGGCRPTGTGADRTPAKRC